MTLKLFHTFAYIIYSSVLPLESLEVNFYSSLCSSYFQVDTWTDKNKSGVTLIMLDIMVEIPINCWWSLHFFLH